MTYRRLFISLCLAGLCMLVGAWWLSLRYYSCVMIGWPVEGSSVTLFSGNLAIGHATGDLIMDPGFIVVPADRVFPPVRDKHGPLGAFEWEERSYGEEEGLKASHFRQLYVPLWPLYLGFVAIANLALRRPMRKQRLLEQQGASPSNSSPGE